MNPYFCVVGWEVLLSLRAQCGSLLPNLTSLTIEHSQSLEMSDKGDPFLWITSFLAPSLVDIRIIPAADWARVMTSYRMTTAILDAVIQRSPCVTKLSIFPDEEATIPNEGDLTHWSGPGFYHFFQYSLALEDLTISSAILESKPIDLLGRLPKLKRLTVYFCSSVVEIDPEFPWPLNLFPSLRELYIIDLMFMDIEPIFDYLKFMLAPLTYFKICKSSEDQGDGWDFITSQFFPALRDMPCLVDIDVDFGTTLSNIHDIGNADTLGILSNLPLQSFSYHWATLGSHGLEQDLLNVWPSLTILNMPHMRVSLFNMSFLAALPCLERLVANLDFFYDPMRLPEPHNVGQRLRFLEYAAHYEDRVCKPTDVVHVAQCVASLCSGTCAVIGLSRYLMSLWPNLVQVIWSKWYRCPAVHDWFTEFLNREISMFPSRPYIENRTLN
jgi:hypothetical protein